MKQIKIDGTSYNIPTKWEEVTFKNWIDIQQIKAKSTFEENIKIVSILSGVPETILFSAEPKLAEKIAQVMEFRTEEIPKEKKASIKLKEKKHVYSGEVSALSLAQYVDIDYRMNEFEKRPWLGLSYIIAILYTPEGEAYNSTYSTQLQREVLTLPITEVIGVVAFFLPKLKRSKKDTQIFSMVNLLLVRMRVK